MEDVGADTEAAQKATHKMARSVGMKRRKMAKSCHTEPTTAANQAHDVGVLKPAPRKRKARGDASATDTWLLGVMCRIGTEGDFRACREKAMFMHK